MAKKLLVLDIDETLLHATESELSIAHDFKSGQYYVYKRPYVDQFLAYCEAEFKVAIWTSSSAFYADSIVRNLFGDNYPLEFIFSRERCVTKFDYELFQYDYIKDLRKVKKKGFNLEEVIMLDDTPSKLRRNYGNLVRIREFTGDPLDKELELLVPYLSWLKEKVDIRKIEKRNWRAHPSISSID